MVADSYSRRLMHAPRRLPETPYWSNDPDVNYQLGRAAVDYLVLTYGVERLVSFMRSYRSRLSGPDVDAGTKPLIHCHAM